MEDKKKDDFLICNTYIKPLKGDEEIPKQDWTLTYMKPTPHLGENTYAMWAQKGTGGFRTSLRSLPTSPPWVVSTSDPIKNRKPTPDEQDWLDKQYYKLNNSVKYSGALLSRFVQYQEDLYNPIEYTNVFEEQEGEQDDMKVKEVKFNYTVDNQDVARVKIKDEKITINFKHIGNPLPLEKYNATLKGVDKLIKFLNDETN